MESQSQYGTLHRTTEPQGRPLAQQSAFKGAIILTEGGQSSIHFQGYRVVTVIHLHLQETKEGSRMLRLLERRV